MLKLKATAAGCLLLCAALGSNALTLGRVRGAALLGQPLDIAIQVQLDGDDNASALCVEADVFHGDTRQEGSRVRVSQEASLPAQQALVRISSPAAIDEPVVTVYLRAGCGQKTSRRYVLLADMPTEVAPAAPSAALPVQVSPPATASAPPVALGPGPASASASTPMPAAPAAAPAAASAPPVPPVAKPVPVVKPRPVAAPKPPVAREKAAPRETQDTKPAAPAPAPVTKVAPVEEKPKLPAAPASQARLKLDPVELPAERIATLEASGTTAQTDAASRDAQRLQSLEGDLKSLLALAAKNENSLLDLQVRLQKAESERYSNGLVWGLGGLLAVSLAAIAFLLGRRRPAGSDHWRDGPRPGAPAHVDSLAAALQQDMMPSAPAPVQASVGAPAVAPQAQDKAQGSTVSLAARPSPILDAPHTQVDVSLLEMSESNFDQLMQTGVKHSAVRKALPPTVSTPNADALRSLSSEALFDVRQQAEFFVSLGQTDQAIRILEARIGEHGESSPMAYIDLLRIFHSLGMRNDFRQVREDFSLLFNVTVPEFSSFRDEGKGLDTYPAIMGQIMASWPTSQVLSIIETAVFRGPANDKAIRYDLCAFQELLLLHALAQQIMDAAVASMKAGGGGVAAPVPMQARPAVAPARPAIPEFSPSGSTPLLAQEDDVDLDLDLTDPQAGVSAFDPMVASPAVTAQLRKPELDNLMDFDPSLLDRKP